MISIVIPIYNEEAIIPELYSRLDAAARKLAEQHGGSYEVIAIDDGSRDRSKEMIRALAAKNPSWKLLSFSRNFGHQKAVAAGIHYSRGDAVVIMDADLQDPPEELHRFLDKWREGYQVVYAVRTQRKENIFKRIAYAAFYRILRRIASIEIPLDSGDFCVIDRSIVEVMRSLPERTRFVRGLRTWAGFRQIGVAYERHERQAGESKYTLSKLFGLAFDGIVSFSSVPLKLASWLGVCFCVASFVIIGLVFAWRISGVTVFGMAPQNALGWTSLVSLMLFLSGIQMLLMGVIGEYLARVFDEVKAREPWIIGDAVGFDGQFEFERLGWHVQEKRAR